MGVMLETQIQKSGDHVINDHYCPSQSSHDKTHGFICEETQYWHLVYFHKESPPNVTFHSMVPPTRHFFQLVIVGLHL